MHESEGVAEVRRFALDDGRDLDELAAGLAARGHFEPDFDRVVDRTVYDTFDWRLWRRGDRLEHEEVVTQAAGRGRRPAATPWLVWRTIDTGEVVGRLPVTQVPPFANRLPDGPTTDRLIEVVEMRALLRLVTVRSRQLGLVLTDDEGKIQARVLIDQAQPPDHQTDGQTEQQADGQTDGQTEQQADDDAPATDDPPWTTVVEVVPVRGYPRAAARVTELLAAQVVLRPVDADPIDQALARAGRHPGDYSSKLSVRLDHQALALDAYATVLTALFQTMVANLEGTRADTDSEFLHDFRVAVRRSRSILGMAAGVVPHDLLEHLRSEFKWLGDVTTPTRDLDVYLLDFDQFEAAVGPSRRGDLASLRSFLVERQLRAQRALAAELDSPRYERLVARLSTWLDDPWAEPGARDRSRAPRAQDPAVELAGARTWKVYRRLVRDGRQITPESPPTSLHDLRKDAKKLRYALECFGSLFDADEIALGVKELKGVQDVLGTFQDCEVQKASLASIGAELIDERGASQASTLIAMGALVDQLDAREATARAAFADRFARFDAPEVRDRFRRLFRPGSSDQAAASQSDARASEPGA